MNSEEWQQHRRPWEEFTTGRSVYGEINLLRPWAHPLFGLEHTVPEFIASLKWLE